MAKNHRVDRKTWTRSEILNHGLGVFLCSHAPGIRSEHCLLVICLTLKIIPFLSLLIGVTKSSRLVGRRGAKESKLTVRVCIPSLTFTHPISVDVTSRTLPPGPSSRLLTLMHMHINATSSSQWLSCSKYAGVIGHGVHNEGSHAGDINHGVHDKGSHAGDISVALDGIGSGMVGGISQGGWSGTGWNCALDVLIGTACLDEVLSSLLK